MSKTTNTPNLAELMRPEDQYPALKPTPMDIISYKLKLARALIECPTRDYKRGGHLYLVLNPDEYKARLKDPTAVLPTKPPIPTEPVKTATTGDTYDFKIFERAETLYDEHIKYDRQARHLLTAKFPTSLDGLIEGGEFAIEITAKDILNHLSDGTDDTAVINDCYNEVLNRLINRPYTSTPNGANSWFKETEDDRTMTIELGHTPPPYAIIMSSALRAFQKSGLPLKAIREVEREWKTLRKDGNLTADNHATYKAFKKHFNTELRHLHSSVNVAPNTANQATGLTSDDLTAVREEIAEVQDNMYATMEHNFRTIQCSIATPATDESTLTGTHRGAAYATGAGTSDPVLATILEKLDRLERQKETPAQRPKPQRTWRHFNKYCWTHGVNASHTSGQCNWQKRGHDKDATHADRRSGSDLHADDWKKWQSPEGTFHDSKGN